MRNFLLEQRKCSYKSVVETSVLGSDPTSDVFLQICVSFYFSQVQSWMRSQTIYTELPHLKEVIANVNLLFMTEWLIK